MSSENKTNSEGTLKQSGFSEQDLCQIKDFQVGELPKNSGFVHPFRAKFIDNRQNNPVQRCWDAIDAHVTDET